MGILSEVVGTPEEQQTAEDSRSRRERCEYDFYLFCSTYLSHWFSSEPAEYQRIIADIISSGSITEEQVERLRPLLSKEKYEAYLCATDNIEGILDAEPREFGKSARALALLIWWTYYKKRKFPVVFCASQGLANDMMSDIKEEIEQNEILFEDFGEMKGKVWRANKITLANGTAIVARGAGTATRGVKNRSERPDAAILDDIMTDAIADSPKQRDKRYRWFKRVVLPLGRDLFPVMINTMLHEDDILSRLFGELMGGKLDGWIGLRFAARKRDGKSLWPQYWSEEKLRKKEQEAGSAAWSTEYMNEPLSSEDAIIKTIHYYELSEVPVAAMRKFGGADPSAGMHDKFALDTLGDPSDGILYVLESWAERIDEAAALDRICDWYQVWNHDSIGFEAIAFQNIYKNNLMSAAAKRGIWLPIFGRDPKGMSKTMRVRKMAPLIEAGFIRFLRTQKELVDQLRMWTPDGPKSAYDDEVDGLWYSFEEAQQSGKSGSVAGAPMKPHRPSALKTMFERFRR